VFTVDTSNLDVVFVSNGIELILLLSKFWKLNVNRCSQSSTKVSWARSDVTKMFTMRELSNLFNSLSSSAKSIENFFDTSSWLHGNNSELIFFINPNEESLGIVVENTSSRWPVSVKVACLQESISFLEQEMVLDELILSIRIHTFKRVEFTGEITFKLFACLDYLLHDFFSLFFRDTWSKRITIQISSDSDSCRDNHGGIFFREIGIFQT